MTKTSEIYQALKSVREGAFTRRDITYAKEHRNESGIRKDLIKISPSTIWRLEERDCVEETPGGYQLTPDGSRLLKQYEEERRKFGGGNVEIIVAKVGGIITYKTRINPNAELKIRKGVQSLRAVPESPSQPSEDTEYNERKGNMLSFLSEKVGPIESVKEEEGLLVARTRMNYHRTTEERNRLGEIAEALGMGIETENEPPNRNYAFYIEGRSPITLVSVRKGKSFKSIEPLEIKVNLKEPLESSKKIIESLIERFYSKKR